MRSRLTVKILRPMELADYSGQTPVFCILDRGRYTIELGEKPIDGLPGSWWYLVKKGRRTNRGARADVWQRYMTMANAFQKRKALKSIREGK